MKMVLANRRELATALILQQLISCKSFSQQPITLAGTIAGVHTMKATYIQHHRVSTQLHQHRLGIETSPLIGGPSWLPLHVKVVVRNKLMYHEWDLIPIDATNSTTLQKLVTLQAVPAQIRHRTYATGTSMLQNSFHDQSSSQYELIRTNIYNADTLLEMSNNNYMNSNDNFVPNEERSVLRQELDHIDVKHPHVLHAHHFCRSFMVRTNMELHLLWNNCWTFAVQLIIYLWMHSYNETMSDECSRWDLQYRVPYPCDVTMRYSRKKETLSVDELLIESLLRFNIGLLQIYILPNTPVVYSMLRTFCSNPGLGGFGNESTLHATDKNKNDAVVVTPDAFCQIIKELVDNAVDACTTETTIEKNARADKVKSAKKPKALVCVAETATAPVPKRVRVVIERFMEPKDLVENYRQDKELLKVTVSDNGCGMNDIQECVGAFHTSKTDYSTSTNAEGRTADQTQLEVNQTAGRYGIGLTLCLLHAQRLVPDSCASIQSATTTDKEWKVVSVVVDTASDTVRCFPRAAIPKSTAAESGTAVSILVPGGPSASLAWPRLAEYFARFKLSLDMTCSLEVLAPTLSRVPLWVHPNEVSPCRLLTHEFMKNKNGAMKRKDTNVQTKKPNCTDLRKKGDMAQTALKGNVVNRERERIWKAIQTYLGRSIDLTNVAYASVPIRMESGITSKKVSKSNLLKGPRLVVAVVVQSRSMTEDDEAVQEGLNGIQKEKENSFCIEEVLDTVPITSKSASMVLIRMVNKIPLLDSAEAAACGLIYGLASKKRMWNSFGLEVTMNIDPDNINAIPTFDVRDSDQVLPFFNQGAHSLMEYDSESDNDNDRFPAGAKRKRHRGSRHLLPAALRLGNVFLIVQIHAEPATLPLPTLCKGRLPIGNKAIDDALEIGITQCLQQLQKTNPDLLLTAAELRKAECDARYVPAVALAVATIMSNATNQTNESFVEQIQSWDESNLSLSSNNLNSAERNNTLELNTSMLSVLIERRLRLVLSHQSTKSTSVPKENIPAVDENADATRNSKISVLDPDSEGEFRNGDLLTDQIKVDRKGKQHEATCHVDDDCDFDIWS